MTKPRSPTLITLGRLVRTFRDAAGLTQKGLAGALGYTNRAISRSPVWGGCHLMSGSGADT
jgi:hypothetical protein